MKKYEYMIANVENPSSSDVENRMLDMLLEEGAKGWRFVPSFFFTKRGQMLFEREKEE